MNIGVWFLWLLMSALKLPSNSLYAFWHQVWWSHGSVYLNWEGKHSISPEVLQSLGVMCAWLLQISTLTLSTLRRKFFILATLFIELWLPPLNNTIINFYHNQGLLLKVHFPFLLVSLSHPWFLIYHFKRLYSIFYIPNNMMVIKYILIMIINKN